MISTQKFNSTGVVCIIDFYTKTDCLYLTHCKRKTVRRKMNFPCITGHEMRVFEVDSSFYQRMKTFLLLLEVKALVFFVRFCKFTTVIATRRMFLKKHEKNMKKTL